MNQEKCLACNKIGDLTYFLEKEKVLSCNNCKALFREHINNNKLHLVQNSTTPSVFQKIKNKITHERFWKLVSDQYVHYLKNKTDMRFKTALDIGSYYGSFVDSLNNLGIDTVGIEANQNFIKLAVTDKIELGYFDQNYKTTKKFDLISLTQVIYYIPDNYAVLEHARNMLNERGMIFISTINPESSLIRNKLTPSIEGEHVNIFLSKKNFESLKEKLGLELINYTTYKPNLFIDMYAKNKLSMLGYFTKTKKAYVEDPDGHHVFLLLKKI